MVAECQLVVPGSSERFLARAPAAGCEVVLDLEDAVPVDGKQSARERVLAALEREGWQTRVLVRVNAPGTPWCHEDLIACAGASPALAGVVIPKVSGPGDIAFVGRLLDGAEAAAGRTAPLAVQALIETPQGVQAVRDIAGSGGRLEALILGYADLAAAMGRPAAAAPAFWQPIQDAVVVAASAHGLSAVDGPCLALSDPERLTAEVAHARACGFDAKWAIHPGQVETISRGLEPSADEIARARAVLEALSAGAAEGRGAVELDGQMLDEVHRAVAQRVIARASR